MLIFAGISWKLTLRAAVDILAGVHSLSCQEVFSVDSKFVWISELDFGEGSTSSWVVNDGSDDSLDETVSFGEVVSSERCWCDSVDTVSLVDALGVTLSLCSDYSSHLFT